MTPCEYLQQIANHRESLARRCAEDLSGVDDRLWELETFHAKLRALLNAPIEDQQYLTPKLFREFVRLTTLPQWKELVKPPRSSNVRACPGEYPSLRTIDEWTGILKNMFLTAPQQASKEPLSSLATGNRPLAAAQLRAGAGAVSDEGKRQ